MTANFLGALIYAVTAMLAFWVAVITRRDDRARNPEQHWMLIAMAFVMLCAWRIANGEHYVHDMLREASQRAGNYEARRPLQVLVVVVLLGFGFAAFTWLAPRLARYSRPARLAGWATAALVAYSAVRAVSLHVIDRIVYATFGPIHLNYVIDTGLCSIAAWTCSDVISVYRRKRS